MACIIPYKPALDTRAEKSKLALGFLITLFFFFMMQESITENRVAEICAANSLSETEIWDRYVDTRIDLRLTHPGGQAIIEAIKRVGKTLKLEDVESAQLYTYLHQKSME